MTSTYTGILIGEGGSISMEMDGEANIPVLRVNRGYGTETYHLERLSISKAQYLITTMRLAATHLETWNNIREGRTNDEARLQAEHNDAMQEHDS